MSQHLSVRQLALPPLPVCAKCPRGQTPAQEKSVDVDDGVEEGNHVMLSQHCSYMTMFTFGLWLKHDSSISTTLG